MGVVTMIYTWFGGFKAVVWTDVLQLSVYLAGGVGALLIAWHLARRAGRPRSARAHDGGQAPADRSSSSTSPTPTPCWAGCVGGALLSAASHGTDHLIVQRLLATRSLRDARVALIGSGVMVIAPVHPLPAGRLGDLGRGTGARPAMPGDQLFPASWWSTCRPGLAGLVIAGILAAAMGTHSSAINSLASSATHDLYASWTGRRDPVHLLRVGRLFSAGLGAGRSSRGALFFHVGGRRRDTPVVVLALSIASVTYGAAARHLFPGRPLAARPRARRGRRRRWSRWSVMLVVVFASGWPQAGLDVARAGRPARLALVRAAGHAARRRHRRGR